MRRLFLRHFTDGMWQVNFSITVMITPALNEDLTARRGHSHRTHGG